MVSTDEFGIDETTATSIPPMRFRIDVGDVDPLSDRACRMTHAHSTGIELRETLRDGGSLRAAVSGVTLYTEHLEDGYPDWHPAPDSFRGMLRLFIYQEITGDSYRTLETYQELAEPFELDHVPDESVLSRTWRNRFDDGVREYVTVAAHFVVEEIHDYGPDISAVRPKKEVTHSKPESSEDDWKDESGAVEFWDEQIRRTTRLARDHGFDGFDSGRAQNVPRGHAVLRVTDLHGNGGLRDRPGSRSVSVPTWK